MSFLPFLISLPRAKSRRGFRFGIMTSSNGLGNTFNAKAAALHKRSDQMHFQMCD